MALIGAKTRECIEIMQAYIDDKPIQARRKGEDEWHTLKGHEIPLWNWEQCEYRIKEVKPHNSAKAKTWGCTKEWDMTDEQLKVMTKDEANKTLSYEDKVRWAELQNSTANLYFIKHGNIEDVPAAGWWY